MSLQDSNSLVDLLDQTSTHNFKWLIEKVQKWLRCVHNIALVAKENPHSAHTVFTKSLQHEWGHIIRVVSGAELYFNTLREVIHNHFLPTVTSLD